MLIADSAKQHLHFICTASQTSDLPDRTALDAVSSESSSCVRVLFAQSSLLLTRATPSTASVIFSLTYPLQDTPPFHTSTSLSSSQAPTAKMATQGQPKAQIQPCRYKTGVLDSPGCIVKHPAYIYPRENARRRLIFGGERVRSHRHREILCCKRSALRSTRSKLLANVLRSHQQTTHGRSRAHGQSGSGETIEVFG